MFIRVQKLDVFLKHFLRLVSLYDDDSELTEFQSRYLQLKSKYQNKLDTLNSKEVFITETQSFVHGFYIFFPNQCNICLPKINIPVFSQKFSDWLNFKHVLVSTVIPK